MEGKIDDDVCLPLPFRFLRGEGGNISDDTTFAGNGFVAIEQTVAPFGT